MAGRPMKISDLEKATGVGRGAIHNYLRNGLMSPPRKTGATMAYYEEKHVREIVEIRRLLTEGYPLSFIKEMMTGTRGKGRARAVDEPAAGRKQEIMSQAIDLFARKGYHQTKISDVTRAIGLGQSTFYVYFPDKKALFLECLDDLLVKMFFAINEEIQDEPDPLLRIRKRAEVTLDSYPQFIDVVEVLRTLVEDNPGLAAKSRDVYEAIAAPVQADLDEAVGKGLIPEMNTRLAAFTLMGFIETARLMLAMDPETTVGGVLDFFEQTILGGLRTRK